MNLESSDKSAIDALELSTALARLGLSQYEERLRGNGFEDWDSVTAITETDLAELDFKRGHRRKLQHAIREYNSSSVPHEEYGATNPVLSFGGQPAVGNGKDSEETPQSSQQIARTTRPYRRHPRPDLNAPQRPKTAYVLFGEHVRQDPALSNSSFTEISKETGKRWRELSHEERVDVWDTPADNRLQEYRTEFERYKQTEDYRRYQAYLEEFKQRQQHPELASPSNNRASPTRESASSSQPIVLLEELEAMYEESRATDDLDLGSQSQDTESPINLGIAEVRHISNALGINANLTRVAAFPSEEMTNKALRTFLDGTGSLLFLWDRDEALNLVRSVYHPQSNSKPILATEVFAMSAVGSYCDAGSLTMLVQEKFLHFFLYMLSLPSDIYGLRYMRLFACLAICRFTNSVESARRLMLSALNIGRQALTSSSFEVENPGGKAHHWRNVFRSVIFLESWFSYNTGNKSRVTEQDLTFYRPSSPNAEDGRGALHERVSELGRLAAYIALDLKTANRPKVEQTSVHFESLNEWHRTLPPPMQLSRLSLADPFTINWSTKRSLLQLHILFLGLFTEPYRNHLLDLALSRLDNAPIDPEHADALLHVEEQCVLAARQSARVASILQTDNLIRSHCWVSVYTSYTGCAILLLSASQRLLELSAEQCVQDLLYATPHLSALSFCSYDNRIARNLHGRLQILFNDIREISVSPIYRTMCELHIVVKEQAFVLPENYDAVEGAKELSQIILGITRNSIGLLQDSLNF
ncbi:uncharacterized protein EKO05_0005345 [Ascochyta rabiei]|uniref:uncharacterized protein n=1 Tax=Didymella rabiei TaxID=5454 RepID=UPI0022042D18|nr:uncharacterized protein EKO05_0005345 [Ascochyta rabiei]UPX14874.1 hypothetical protein EKO05_0005345 [Ascochyta rabiei]